jgi:hypothetical protein
MKYDIITKHVDENYGFAVQPLFTVYKDKIKYLVQGQYQLPVYSGECPHEVK